MAAKTTSVENRFRPNGRNWPLMYAFLIACGGSTKTTSATSLAVTNALRGYKGTIWDLDANLSTSLVCGYDEKALEGRKNVYDLVTGRATLDEIVVPARYRIGDGYEDDAFMEIPNLNLVPGSIELAQADTYIALDADAQDWFKEVLESYDGDDEIWYLDFPASYGRMVYSVARMLDENDSVVPSVRADPKDIAMLPKLLEELVRIREKNRNRRSVPGRPTVNHLLLTGTPTATYSEAAPRRAKEIAEKKYGHWLLPFVRYSADAKKIYEDTCPLPVILPNSYPAEDYRKVSTSLGYTDRT